MNWFKKLFTLEDTTPSKFTSKEYDTLALNLLYGKLQFLSEVCYNVNQNTLNDERETIRKLQEWTKNLEDRKYAAALNNLIGYAGRGADRYEKELKTGSWASQRLERDKEYHERQQKNIELEERAAELSLPKPPHY